MKAHTSGLKDALKTFPLQTNEKITFGTTVLTSDDLINVEPVFNGNILKSMMKGLTIESTTDIPKDTVINYQKGILVNDSYEYLNFGNYVVVNSEKKEDADSYLITCYDKLVYSAVDYVDLNLTYPISIADYLEAICNYLGLTLKTKIFNNADLEIPSELYLNLGYKFRDVLDEISQATGTSICLDLNDQVELRVPIATNDTIDEDFIASVNAKFGEKYGPINSVVLSRSAESDNVYIKDDESIALNGLCELKISDNQIMNGNDRSDYLQGIADNIFGLEYYTNDYNSTGVYYYDFLDKYSISIDSQTYNCLMLNDDISTIDDSENIFTKIPDVAKTDYSQATTTDKEISRAMFIVDKVEGEIDAKVSKDDIIADLNLAIQDGQGVIRATGNTFILDADNASIDAEGNAEFENATLRGGNLVLEDDGTEENASIKILQNNIDPKIYIAYGYDLSNKTISIDCRGMTYDQLRTHNNEVIFEFKNDGDSITNIPLTFLCYEYNNVKSVRLDLGSQTYFFYKGVDAFVSQIWTITIPTGNNYRVVNLTDSEMYEKFYIPGTITSRETSYTGMGLEAKVFPGQKFYNNNDYNRVRRIVEGTITPTDEDYELYDFDGDGDISIMDYHTVDHLAMYRVGVQNPYHFKLDYNNPGALLTLKYSGASLGQDLPYKRNVLVVGVNGVEIEGYLSIGNYQSSKLLINGIEAENVFAPKELEEFTSQITFNESVAGNTHFYKQGNMCYVYLQGEGKTHSNNQLIATLPSGYRPSKTIFAPFVVNAGAYGELVINTNGNINVNIISSTSVSGRIYANFTYPL